MPLAPQPTESARDRLRRASASLDLAEVTGHPFAMSQTLAEVARAYQDLGVETSAESHFEAALRWARLGGGADPVVDLLCEAADAAVRVARALEGETAPSAGPAKHSEIAHDDAHGHAAALAAHAARERARDRAFEASQLAAHLSDPSCEARLLLRVCEVLQRCGDHADALQMQLRALDRMGGVAPRDPSRLSGFGRLADA